MSLYNQGIDQAAPKVDGVDGLQLGPDGKVTSVIFDYLEQDTGLDLSNRNRTIERSRLLFKANRENASENLFTRQNHRFRGNRESYKFNLAMNRFLAVQVNTLLTLKNSKVIAQNNELSVYPTYTEMRYFYAARSRCRFAEYQILKSADQKWFST